MTWPLVWIVILCKRRTYIAISLIVEMKKENEILDTSDFRITCTSYDSVLW